MKQNKEAYVSPQVEVIRMENEGVIAASVPDIPGHTISSNTYSGRSGKASYNSASFNDVEDLINDILTVGE